MIFKGNLKWLQLSLVLKLSLLSPYIHPNLPTLCPVQRHNAQRLQFELQKHPVQDHFAQDGVGLIGDEGPQVFTIFMVVDDVTDSLVRTDIKAWK